MNVLRLLLATTLIYEAAATPVAHAAVLNQPTSLNQINNQSMASAPVLPSYRKPSASETFQVPSSVGSIVETYAPSKATRLVYHFQDVHENISAQINLSEMVSLLEAHAAKQGKTLLVAVEGMASGSINWDRVTAMPDQKAKEDVGSALLRAGYMLGEEYAVMTNRPGRIQLVGLENKDLYNQNKTARSASNAARKRVLNVVRETRDQLRKLAPHNFNALLTSLETKRIAAEEGTLPLGEYVSFLKSVDAAVIARHPNLARMARLSQDETGIDFEKVEQEGRQLVQDVMAVKSEKEIDRMLADAQALKEGRLSPLSYYSSLLSQSSRAYPLVRRYTDYLRASEGIDAERLFDEVLEAEAEIAMKLVKHPLARALFENVRWVELQERFFALNLIPQEWNQQRGATLADIMKRHEEIRAFVAEQVSDLGYEFTTPALPAKEIQAAYEGARGFYEAANTRDDAMIENLKIAVNATDASKTVVAFIAGGFHTPGMTKLLRANGFAYEVVRPQLETEVELSRQINIASRKVSYLRSEGVGPIAAEGAVNAAGDASEIKNIAETAKPDENTGSDPLSGPGSSAPKGIAIAQALIALMVFFGVLFATVNLVSLPLATALPRIGVAAGVIGIFSFLAMGLGMNPVDANPEGGSFAGGAISGAAAQGGRQIEEFKSELGTLVADLKTKEVATPVVVGVDVAGLQAENVKDDGNGFVGLYSALNAATYSADRELDATAVVFASEGDVNLVNAFKPSKNQVAPGVKLFTTETQGTNVRDVASSIAEVRTKLAGSVFVLGAGSSYEGAEPVAVTGTVEQAVRAFALGRYGKDNADEATRRYLELLYKYFGALKGGHFTEDIIATMVSAIMA